MMRAAHKRGPALLNAWLPVLALAAMSACGGGGGGGGQMDAGNRDTGTGPNEGLPVGSPCTSNSQCESPTSPECLSEVKPLASTAGVPADIAALGLEFPNGYCSSTISCASTADCGSMGQCFRPFEAVTAPTLRELEAPLGVTEGTLDFLPSYGVCLRNCTSASECEVGQICDIPLNDFVSLVPGAVNETKFCIPDPDCAGGGCTAGPCSPNPCMNGGSCTANGTSYTCACPQGYAGTNCEMQTIIPTAQLGDRCTMDAQCDTARGGHAARCLPYIRPLENVAPTEPIAFVGLEFPYGYCSNEPNCASNLECGPRGKCLAPFREVPQSELDELVATFPPELNIPSDALDFLPSYGVCLRACTDSYECAPDQACQLVLPELIDLVDYSVNTQKFCVPHNDCRFCSRNATCLLDAVGDGARCVCDAGFTGDPEAITCNATGNGACAASPCQNGGTCTDGENNSYTCNCVTGYQGTNCQMATACTPNPCMNNGTCTPTSVSTYMCTCPPGYSGDTCNIQMRCPALATPANGTLSVPTPSPVGSTATFACNVGFTLSGPSSITCQPNLTWSQAAPTCVSTGDPCAGTPCQHGGQCFPGSGSNYTCDCAGTGYTGTTCGTPVNCGSLGTLENGQITTNPPSSTTFGATATYMCNGGYTLVGTASRSCGANGAWSGMAPTCMMNTGNPCSPNPCLNGSSCMANGGSYMCMCAPGYEGMNCQTNTNNCAPNPCLNGGTCTDGVNTYTCSCPNGYTGTNCQNAPPQYCDVVYRFYTGTTEHARFHVVKRNTGTRNAQEVVGRNETSSAQSGPFNNTTAWPGGYVRMRFNANAAGNAPVAGPVRIVEYFFPIEFSVTVLGTTVNTNVDHSAGLLNYTNSCANGITGCLPAQASLALNRACTPVATGVLSGTSLMWDTCNVATPPAFTATSGNPSAAQEGWTVAMSQTNTAMNPGCLANYATVGNVSCNGVGCGFVPDGTLGVQNTTFDQKLPTFTFSGTNYQTATVTIPEFTVPDAVPDNYSGVSSPITAVGVSMECGQLAALTCNEN